VRLNDLSGGGRTRQRGVSLIEILVSTVVVSVGALSATSLQLVSKRNNRDASQRLEATHLTSTLIERMRANNSPAALQAYVTTAGTTVGLGRVDAALHLNCTTNAASCCTDATSTCSVAQVAAVELWQWEQVMDGRMEQVGTTGKAGGLDQPTACVDPPAAGAAGRDGFYTVTIAFRGTIAITDDGPVTCGRNAAYADGTPLYGAHNEYRRTLTLSAYITPSVAK
jgi:type IV pilus assembly protein PilV